MFKIIYLTLFFPILLMAQEVIPFEEVNDLPWYNQKYHVVLKQLNEKTEYFLQSSWEKESEEEVNALFDEMKDSLSFFYAPTIDKLKEIINALKVKTDFNLYQNYYQVIRLLREIEGEVLYQEYVNGNFSFDDDDINKKSKKEQLIALYQNIVWQLYLGVDLKNYGKNVVEKFLPQKSEFSAKGVGNGIREIERKVQLLDNYAEKLNTIPLESRLPVSEYVWGTCKGEISCFGFDSHLMGNPLSLKFQVDKGEGRVKLYNIRMGSPTVSNLKNYMGAMDHVLAPEFKVYLDQLKSQGKKHFYFSFQKRNVTKWGEYLGVANETGRVGVLEKLALEGSPYFGVIDVFTFDMNSDFYFQRPSFAQETKKTRAFLREFEEAMEKENGAFFIPPYLRNNTKWWRKNISDVMTFIHSEFFDDKEELTLDDRKVFIDLAYTLIPQKISAKEGFSYNRTCKDGIDRAGMSNALEYTLLMLMKLYQERGIGQSFGLLLDHYEAEVFKDAFLAKGRAMTKERRERLKLTSLFLIKSFETRGRELLENIQKEFSLESIVLL